MDLPSAGRPPTSKDAEAPLQRIVGSINAGWLFAFLSFDRYGRPVILG